MSRELQTRQSILGNIIFASRWLQLPIYLGLIIVQGIYALNCQTKCNDFLK